MVLPAVGRNLRGQAILSKYEVGTREEGNLRFCGKRLICKDDAITIDVADNTRKVTKITIDAARDRNSQPCTAKEISTLRSVIGSLSWIARQGPPDLRIGCQGFRQW